LSSNPTTNDSAIYFRRLSSYRDHHRRRQGHGFDRVQVAAARGGAQCAGRQGEGAPRRRGLYLRCRQPRPDAPHHGGEAAGGGQCRCGEDGGGGPDADRRGFGRQRLRQERRGVHSPRRHERRRRGEGGRPEGAH